MKAFYVWTCRVCEHTEQVEYRDLPEGWARFSHSRAATQIFYAHTDELELCPTCASRVRLRLPDPYRDKP